MSKECCLPQNACRKKVVCNAGFCKTLICLALDSSGYNRNTCESIHMVIQGANHMAAAQSIKLYRYRSSATEKCEHSDSGIALNS